MDPQKVLKKIWKNYKSIWFGMFLLGLIMCVCIYGTVFYAANSSLGDNAIPLAKAKVFYAWWFLALLIFFFIQFIISTWKVTTMSVTLWSKKVFRQSTDSMKKSKSYQEFDSVNSVEDVESKLKKKFTLVHRDGNRFFAHKGLLSRMGPTIIHTGIVIILITGMAQILLSRLGDDIIVDEGRFAASEGEELNFFFTPRDHSRIISESNIEAHEIRTKVKVHDFDEIKHSNADVPSYYSSLLEITDPDSGKVRFVLVDMNHSVSIEGYQFHQASFTPVPPIQGSRTNFDIRQGSTGDRVAIVDLEPGTKSMIGETDYMIEVEGVNEGDTYYIYKSSNPFEPIIEGSLHEPAVSSNISLKATRIIPDFVLEQREGDEQPKPYSRSNVPRNPALFLDIMEDGEQASRTVIFMDKELNDVANEANTRFRLDFVDIKAAPQEGSEDGKIDFDQFDWTAPEAALFVVNVFDKKSDELLSSLELFMEEPSESIQLDSKIDIEFPVESQFVVIPAGTTLKYVTVLSVVKDPVTHYYTFGVGLIFLGAMMTFSFRYLAFYGIWMPETSKLAVELKPRFGEASSEDIQWIESILNSPENDKQTTLSEPKPTV